MAKAEGKSFDFLDESHIDPSLLEVFDFDSPQIDPEKLEKQLLENMI